MIPSWFPSGSTSRTSRARIRSLIRGSLAAGVAMWHHSLLDTKKADVREATSAWCGVRSTRAHLEWPGGGVRPASRSIVLDTVPAMSSLWTPGGERPVEREPSGPTEPDVDREPTPEELEALTRELASTPVAVVVANHAMGLFELAALHLSQQPPNLAESAMAIDSMAALVEGLAGRLGENEPTLKDALAQLRMAFVQIRAGSATPADEE